MSELKDVMAAVNDINQSHGVTQKGGKKYTEVAKRVEAFRTHFGLQYGITTNLIIDDGKRVIIKAQIFDLSNPAIPVGEGYAEERMEDMVVHYEEGRNYIKLIKTEESERGHRSNVLGFIVKKSPKATDNKTKQPFNVGDMLMAAGYNAPATNFARGNVFEELNPANVRWTGI